jgi:hypothetical protein
VYEAITVEPSVLRTITVHASPSNVESAGTVTLVGLFIWWAIFIATICFCLCILSARLSRHEEDNVPANVAKGPEQRLPEMNERAVPGPTIIRPPYKYSSSSKSIWSDAGRTQTAAVDRDSPHVLQPTVETVMTIM